MLGRPAIGPAYEFKFPRDLRAELEEIAVEEGVPLAEALRRAARLGAQQMRVERMQTAGERA